MHVIYKTWCVPSKSNSEKNSESHNGEWVQMSYARRLRLRRDGFMQIAKECDGNVVSTS